MRKTSLLLASCLLLGLAACTDSAVTSSGGSGMDEDSYSSSTSPQYCPPGDTNCWEFYHSPGGG